MLNFVQTNILEMIEMYGEDKCQNILSSFYCPLNHDVEDFLHTKAISFAKQHLAMTFLVFIKQHAQQDNSKKTLEIRTMRVRFQAIFFTYPTDSTIREK